MLCSGRRTAWGRTGEGGKFDIDQHSKHCLPPVRTEDVHARTGCLCGANCWAGKDLLGAHCVEDSLRADK
jgi:hypothetical protein